MRLHGARWLSSIERVGLLAFVAVLAACGQGGGTTSGGGTGGGASADVTTDANPCVEVYEGDLLFCPFCPEGAECGPNGIDDIELVRNVRRITGRLSIRSTTLDDLTAFSCLEEVLALRIESNANLKTLHGLERLSLVEGLESPYLFSINIQDNPALESLDGLDSLRELDSLAVWFNESLTSIGVPSLEHLGALFVGGCQQGGTGSVAEGVGDNPSLGSLDGFDALESLDVLVVGGQTGLTSLAALVELANGGTVFGTAATIPCIESWDHPAEGGKCGASFQYNPSLDVTEIEAFMELAAVNGDVCGNLGDAEVCECLPT